jgi:hypothetical protein
MTNENAPRPIEYKRVIPRDLFNESKLLKCVGRLALKIHDSMGPEGLKLEYDDKPFEIRLDGYKDAFYVENMKFHVNGRQFYFYSQVNSHEPYPFFLFYNFQEFEVFDVIGNFNVGIMRFFKNQKKIIDSE